MGIFNSILCELLDESLIKVKHSSIRVHHMSGTAKKKAKAFRIKNKTKLKAKAKKRKLKLKMKPKAKKGYSWGADGKLHKKVKRLGLRKRKH